MFAPVTYLIFAIISSEEAELESGTLNYSAIPTYAIISWLAEIHPHYISNIYDETRKKYFCILVFLKLFVIFFLESQLD